MSNWVSALANGSFIYHNSRHLKWNENKFQRKTKTKLLSNKSCKLLFIYYKNNKYIKEKKVKDPIQSSVWKKI